MAASSEASERRWLVFCVSERPEENVTLWSWTTSKFFDAQRDCVTFLYCRTETEVITTTMRALRSTIDAAPHWMPPAITEALATTPFVTVDFVQIVSDLSTGDAIAAWIADARLAISSGDGAPPMRPTALLLSSRGHTGLRRFLVGSVSGFLTEQAKVPCLIVRSQLAARVLGPEANQQDGSRVIGIAVDGTSAGRALVEWCRAYVLRPSDRVIVLHGRRTGQKTDDELAAIDNAINALQTVTAAVHAISDDLESPPATELLAEGDDVRDAICDWVERSTPDLLIVGSRGLTGVLRRLALGSVSSYCIAHAASPILVVSATVLSDLTADALREQAAEAAVNAAEWVHVSPRTSLDAS